ncbi:DUF3618 domain-containing protein [Nonomuraea sp. NPDC049714]|uniref:DUF3618 domain-containing protein n=1 Tax=Nonomuraea sp. NPDC049714 TaxID=3364357 RepID=UPI00378BD4D4
MSEMNPGRTDKQHAGTVGARRAAVGEPIDHESINVPPTRPGAAENAHEAERAREGHETFVPEAPQRDDRTDAVRSRAVEEESLQGGEPRHEQHPSDERHSRERHERRHSQDGARQQDADDVRQDIRQTRQELGETVHALAQKADVKSRAGEAAATAKGRAGHMAETAKGKAAEMTETAKEKAAEFTGTAKGKAAEMTGAAKGKAAEVTGTAKGKATEVAGTVKGKAAVMADKVHDATPEQARKRPMLMIAAMGAVLAFVVRRIMRRNRAK